MATKQTTCHRGYIITARCSATEYDRFEASFTVFPPICANACWQRFARRSFLTAKAATEDAMGAARAIVDLDAQMATLTASGFIPRSTKYTT